MFPCVWWQDHDDERYQEHTVQGQVLVPEELPLTHLQGIMYGYI